MESNFQTRIRDGCRGDLEPRRRYSVEGRRPLERATNMEIESRYCWGFAVEHMLDNAEVAVHYEIMNSDVPCMGIQAHWYRVSPM